MSYPYTLPYTNWNQPDIGGLAQCIAYIMSGGGDITGFATEDTQLDNKALLTLIAGYLIDDAETGLTAAELLTKIAVELIASSDGTTAGDLLEAIDTKLILIESVISNGSNEANSGNFVNGVTANITNTTVTDVLAAAGASTYNYLTTVMVTNGGTVSTWVKIMDETSGAILCRGYATSGGGGFVAHYPTPIKQLVANKKVQAQCETTGAEVCVNITGFKGS